MNTTKGLQTYASDLLQAARETGNPEHRRRLLDEALASAQQAEAVTRHGGAKLAARSPQSASPTYTLYLLANGHFSDARHFVAGSDEAALAVAYAVQDACSDMFGGFELWQRTRRIKGTAWPRPQPLAADVAAEAQMQVVELEESLLASRHCLAESRKLIEATDELRKRLREPSEID